MQFLGHTSDFHRKSALPDRADMNLTATEKVPSIDVEPIMGVMVGLAPPPKG